MRVEMADLRKMMIGSGNLGTTLGEQDESNSRTFKNRRNISINWQPNITIANNIASAPLVSNRMKGPSSLPGTLP